MMLWSLIMPNRALTVIFVFLAILTCSPHLFAQTQDDLFNSDILHEVRLYMAPQDLVTFKETNFECEDQELEGLAGETISPLPRVICWFPVEFHWKFNGQDITLPQVGIESHGKGSRSNIKPSFKIDFSRYESRLNFLGLRYLVLRANTQDASQMHERVAMTFFRKLGIPAPREVHTRLYINDQYAGAYTIVEYVDPIFTQQRFGESDGYLYAYEWVYWVFQYLGPDTKKYSPLPFKPENHLVDFDPGPIELMVRAVNQSPDAQFSSAVSPYIDLNALFRELAAESFVVEEDGIIGDFGVNNLFLYRFQNSLQSIFIPWDKSNAFYQIDRDIFHNFTTDVLTIRALADAPELIAYFKDVLLQAAAVAGGPGGWLEQEITKEYQQIQQAVYEDPVKLCYNPDRSPDAVMSACSNDHFETEVAYLIQFARQRSAIVQAQLAGQ
jgi:spore coat protein CotH